jgi:hypothetical protein
MADHTTAFKTSAAAAPVLDEEAMALLERIDAALVDLATELGARQRRYPALIAAEALGRAEYPRAFPHLLMTAASLADPSAAPEDLLTPANITSTPWCLSPAVCLHVYNEYAGRRLEAPLVITARGRCFRHEEQTSPGVRQIEFAMREIVLLGDTEWIEDALPELRSRLEQLARSDGLEGNWAAAEDPFFLPAAQGKAYLQRLQETKHEYQMGDDPPLALVSINRHGTFFSERFALRSVHDEPLHTACVAVGLDRWRWRISQTRSENP